MTLDAFDVVVVPFPYSDVLAEKRRPAVVVSVNALEQECDLVWLVMVTSTGGPLRLGDHAITDLAAAGLSTACRVRASKITSLDRDRVLRRTGALSAVDADAVRLALKACAAF